MLPDWMKQVEGKGHPHFECDPDVFYPMFLEEMGVSEDGITQYDLEVAYGCMMMDANRAARMSGSLKGHKG